MLPRQSQKHSSPQNRAVRKLEIERDQANSRLARFKQRQCDKKAQRSRSSLARQVLRLTIQHTRALIDGEI